MNYVLDTCVLSGYSSPTNVRVIDWLNSVDEEKFFISVITIGEIQHGIERLPDLHRKTELLIWMNNRLLKAIRHWFCSCLLVQLRLDTRRTSGRGRSRLSKTARADGRRRGCSVSAPSTAIRWIERWATTGSVAALPGTGHDRSPLEAHRQWLLDLVAAEPDLTLEEIRARLESEKRLKTGTTSVWRFYERHDITFKKNSARRRTGSS